MLTPSSPRDVATDSNKRFGRSSCPTINLTDHVAVTMRLKLLLLACAVPVVLTVVPRFAQAQREHGRCRDESACIRDGDFTDHTRERALRFRDEASDRARFARETARLRHLDAADRARDNGVPARIRAEEQRARARDLREMRRYEGRIRTRGRS